MEAAKKLPLPLCFIGKCQCKSCRVVISLDDAEISQRYPEWGKEYCRECKKSLDAPCRCSRPCTTDCDRYPADCQGCKMPPCEECEANKHLKEANQ